MYIYSRQAAAILMPMTMEPRISDGRSRSAEVTAIPTRPHPVLHAQYRFLDVSIPLANPHVIIVSLNRPHKRNAIHGPMWSEIRQLFATHLGRIGDGCRCVILTGSMTTTTTRTTTKSPVPTPSVSAFCAGIDVTNPPIDLSAILHRDHEKSNPQIQGPTRRNHRNHDDRHPAVFRGLAVAAPTIRDMQDAFTALERECPVPVIAAIHGHCLGAGVDLIAAADVRWCASDAVFAVREVALGLAADVGTLQRLPKIVGSASWVRDVCLTGRQFDAHEARHVGLVSRVVEVHDGETNAREAVVRAVLTQCCAIITAHSPVAVHGTKQALVYARDHSVQDGLAQIANYNALALQGPDVASAFVARGRPRQTKKPLHDDDNDFKVQGASVFPDFPPFSRL